MKLPLRAGPIFLLLCAVQPGSAPEQPLAAQGDRLFSDELERQELGDWKSVIPTFTVAEGV